MGSIKKVLADVTLRDYPSKRLAIEANHGTTGGVDIIHLQTEFWRIELDEAEMQSFGATVLQAAEELKKLKRPANPRQLENRVRESGNRVSHAARMESGAGKTARPHEPPS